VTLDISSLPKVVLHDHLDGGLRPSTVLDLAHEVGYRGLPTTDPDDLADWFDQSGSSSLEEYLIAFEHTTAVMSTPEAVERVAYEAAEDLARDGVVYAEIRFAPSLHSSDAMDRRAVIAAVVRGLEAGERDHGVVTRAIVDAMRQHDDSADVAAMAVEAGGRVVAFDLAGPEAGYPASNYAEACRIALDGGLRLTLHAGEGDGVESIAGALSCGAERIGHGVRIIEDTTVHDGAITAMGDVATRVHSGRIPLEVCPRSNLDTHMFPTAADHPVGMLHRAGFAVTLNTDNRLMSQTAMSREFGLVVEHHGFTKADLQLVTLRGVDAAFCDEDTRRAVRSRVEGGYA
jgi:adenosine deaminase